VKLPNACPKPKKSGRRKPKTLTRTRMKSRNAKRKGSAFPAMRDPAFCAWVVTAHRCVGRGLVFERRVSLNDSPDILLGRFVHRCWGAMTPAHVGLHRAQGVGDRGRVVPMCEALHTYYDNRRGECNAVLPDTVLERIALRLDRDYPGGSGDPNP
jgi:hypothetical protein